MASTPTRNFSLTVELDGFIRMQVASGQYANASEVVRAGLRLLIERQNALGHPTAPVAQDVRSQ